MTKQFSLHPVTYCPNCDSLTQHVDGDVIGFTKENATKVYHRKCLNVVVKDSELYYVPKGKQIPSGYTLVEGA